MAIIEEGNYKGRATLSIKNKPDDKWPFTFGMAKARLIVENIDAIRAFYDKHKNDPKPQKEAESFS